MTLPQVDLTGTVCTDPELKWTKDGDAMVRFRVVCNERRKNEQGEWYDARTAYLTVVAWRRLAEEVAGTIVKGERVRVGGKWVPNEWQTMDGEKRESVEVHADAVFRPVSLSSGGDPQPVRKVSRFVDDEEPF